MERNVPKLSDTVDLIRYFHPPHTHPHTCFHPREFDQSRLFISIRGARGRGWGWGLGLGMGMRGRSVWFFSCAGGWMDGWMRGGGILVLGGGECDGM